MSWRIDRLTARVLLGLMALVITPTVAAILLLHRYDLDRSIEIHRKSADLQARLLVAALEHQMLTQDHQVLERTLSEIGSEQEVSNIMILDHEGLVAVANPDHLRGEQLDLESPTCIACHDLDSGQRQRTAVVETPTGRTLRLIHPLANRPACQGCHPSTQRINGFLLLDISMSELDRQIRDDGNRVLALSAFLAALLLLGAGWIVRKLILERVDSMGRMALRISQGHLDARVEEGGHDLLGVLERDLNHMGRQVERLVDQVEERGSQLSTIVESLSDGLVVLDSALTVIASNGSFRHRCGRHDESMAGTTCREVRTRLSCRHGEGRCPSARCLVSGEVEMDVFRTGIGDDLLIEEVYASPISNDEGQVVQVVEIWRDITERQREEERLAEFEHLSSLGILASGLSHQLNTPLASILTSAESLLGQLEGLENPSSGSAGLQDGAEIIRQEALRCKGFTEQFRRFSRGIPPNIEPLELRRSIEPIVALVMPTARTESLTIRIEGKEEIPLLSANTEVVQHVILNLLTNAIQASEGRGGEICILLEDGDPIRVQVRDTGRGIDDRTRARLFRPFRTQKVQGTGLGLFLSRSFMRRFGGDLRLVESQVDVGSCFELTFPTTVSVADEEDHQYDWTGETSA